MKDYKQQFITNSINKFKDQLDYSLVEWSGNKKKVTLRCRKHDHTFVQIPTSHLNSKDPCPLCRRENNRAKIEDKLDDILEKLNKVHNNEYDYSLVKKRPRNESCYKIDIICKKHGVFSQSYNNHLYGSICPKCSFDKRIYRPRVGKEEFIRRARAVHGDKYDYSKVEYKNQMTKVTLICKKHGDFQIQPFNHLYQGSGCIHCFRDSAHEYDRQIITVDRLKTARANKFTYENTVIKQHDKRITVTCREHGDFQTIKWRHLKGLDRCPKCPWQRPWDVSE